MCNDYRLKADVNSIVRGFFQLKIKIIFGEGLQLAVIFQHYNNCYRTFENNWGREDAEQALRMIFGASPLPYSMPSVLRGQVFIGDFIYSYYRLMMLAVAVVAVTLTWLLIYRTPFGRVVRAGVQNPEMVGALGISLEPYMMAIAALGVGLAGLCGVLLAPIVTIHPAMGQEILTAAFVVVVIGGLGSFWGVVAAALLVGVVCGMTIHFVPAAGEASIYVLMFLVLLVRPRGLLGERIEKFE